LILEKIETQHYFYYIGDDMIKGIMAGYGLTVSGGTTSYPYVPMNTNNPIQGMIRINGQDTQVFDGSTWQTMYGSIANVEFTGEVQSILDWARRKKAEEEQLDELCKKYPGLGKARDNFETFKRLVRAEEDVPQSVQSSP
jgi:hypothetical protein